MLDRRSWLDVGRKRAAMKEHVVEKVDLDCN